MSASEVAQRLEPLFPALDELDRRLSLALYRELARGAPARLNELLDKLEIDAADGTRRVRSWPGVYYDGEQRIIGYWGLGLGRTRHRLLVGAQELFAWCAWDTLFLPALLDARAEVESICRGTGQAVKLAVGTTGIESAHPPALAVSFVVPEERAVRADVIASFCRYVHLFSTEEAACGWREQHPAAFLLPLSEAFEVGRLVNRRRYG